MKQLSGLLLALILVGAPVPSQAQGLSRLPSIAAEASTTKSPEEAAAKHHREEHGKHQGKHRHGRHDRLAHLRKSLGLSQTQVDQIKPLIDKQEQLKRTRMESARQQMLAVLTPEQKARWEAMKARRHKHGSSAWQHDGDTNKGHNRDSSTPPDPKQDSAPGLKAGRYPHAGEHGHRSGLGLTDEQKARLKAQHKAAWESTRKEMDELDSRIASFLTPEQRVQFTNQMKRHRHHPNGKPHKHEHSHHEKGHQESKEADTEGNEVPKRPSPPR